MEYIHYDDIAAFDEAALDCLSLEALLDELFGDADDEGEWC